MGYKALSYVEEGMVLGIGTGSTVGYFIEALKSHPIALKGVISSSVQTTELLKHLPYPILDPNTAGLDLYIDGADECNAFGQMIKGGGGAHTQEKILAALSPEFICLIDHTKFVTHLGNFPLAIEVLPAARSYVARMLVKLGGRPHLREHFLSDHNNPIIDVQGLDFSKPIALEAQLKQIVGVVEHGLFAEQRAHKILIGKNNTVECLIP